MTPRQEGYKAYFDGIEIEDNPYPSGEQEADDWEDGWMDAGDEELRDHNQPRSPK